MGFGNEVAAALAVMRMEKKVYRDYLPEEAILTGKKMVQATRGLWADVLETVMEMVKKEIPLEYPHVAVWWYSVLLEMDKDNRYFLELVKYVRNHKDAFSPNTQHFLYYQLKYKRFVCQKTDAMEIKEEMWRYFKEVVASFEAQMKTSLEWIPRKERDNGLVLVITEQFLAVQHGPTKTALDRCKALMTQLGKRVLLINTGEMLSKAGRIPFIGGHSGNYLEDKRLEREQSWKGVVIPYYQCSRNMPDLEELDDLLLHIRRMAPDRVVSIGGSGILSNLVSRMLPVLTVGLAPSDLEATTTEFQTLSRRITERDLEMLSGLGYDEKHVIESVFTSSLKPQTETISRKELGIPDDTFLMVIVGARLDDEITEEFLKMLEGVVRGNMHIGFFGRFNRYEERIERHPVLKEYTTNFGFCMDILSRLELSDLYINPLRKGGGTSCVEAMYKGVPVVTIGYGDVSVNAGEEFWVEDYTEMQRKILRYYEDKEYYARMSEKAKMRSEILLDTDTEFVRIMNVFEQREAEIEKA